MILHGNIGNIYNHQHIQNNKNVNQTIICKYKNNCKILIDKNRHGPIGKILTAWLADTMQVKNLAY